MDQNEEDFEEGPIITEHDVEEILQRRPCNSRIDELAKPNKRLVLAMWESYAHRFEPERKETVRLLLQELYSLTPEETEKYFKWVTKIMNKVVAKRILKRKLLKRSKARMERQEKNRAHKKFKCVMRCLIEHVVKLPTPPLVSPRLRHISNLLLEQLCDICNAEVPERGNGGESQKYINIADFMAIGFENTYFEVQAHKNKEFDLIEEDIKQKEKEKEKGKANKKRKGSINKT